MAGYTPAAGVPNLNTLGHIPTLYAARLLVEFYNTTVLGEIANTDYEGMIKQKGDTVRIRSLPDIVIRDYVPGQNLVYETPAPSYVDLVIDQGKYFALSLNKVQEVQSDIQIRSAWAEHGAQKLKIAIDSDFLADIVSDSHASNLGATAGAISGDINLGASGAPVDLAPESDTGVTGVVDFIANCGLILDEQNIPETGRWMVIPGWMGNFIKRSQLKDASLSGDSVTPLRNGKLGMVDRFMLYVSNQISTTSADSAWSCPFGHQIGLSFASQIVESETIKNPTDFGDLLRALQVYGWKVTKSEALGTAYVAKG